MKAIVKIEMHPQNSCPLFSYPYACLHLSSTVFWNQNNPWFSYPYAISVLYSSTPMLSRGMRLRVQRYENNVDDGKAISPSNTTFVAMDNSEVPHDLWPWCFHEQLKLMSTAQLDWNHEAHHPRCWIVSDKIYHCWKWYGDDLQTLED